MTDSKRRNNHIGAKVALFGFNHDKDLKFKKAFKSMWFRLSLPWQQIGKVKEYIIEYVEIPWSEQEFASFSLERQRSIFFRILADAKKRGAIISGMPMSWRSVLGNKAPIAVAEGKELAISGLISQMQRKLGWLENRQIAVIGIEESWHKKVVDSLLDAGVQPILTGSKGKSLSENYFKNSGVAIPVLKAAKAVKSSDCALILSGVGGKALGDKAYIFKELNIALAGDWGKPFQDGIFPCGLAAAIIDVGGEKRDIKFLTPTINSKEESEEKLA